MQRMLIIGAVVIVLLGGAVGAYLYFAPASKITVTPTPTDTSGLTESGTASTTPATDDTQTVVTGAPQKVLGRLAQITKDPVVAGEVAFAASSTDPSQGVVVRYLDRRSGNSYQFFTKNEALSRISNKTIPGIQEATWLANGSLAYVRYLSGEGETTINTYALPAVVSNTPGQGGYFLAQNIVSFAANATNVLAVASGASGSSATLEKLDGSQPKQVFATPLTSLRASFLGKGYLVFTKPSAILPGYAFSVNTTGLFERLAGPLNGLVALASPSGKWVLVSYTSGGLFKLMLVNATTHESIALPVATIADKCVWSVDDAAVYCGVPISPPTSAQYPDDWYQGAVSFNDRIWKVDVNGRFAELVLDFTKETDAALDATALAIDPKSTVLVFKNKKDASLWAYEL